MGQGVTLEICVDSLGLALAAARGGADRIELCGPLQDGGITPSAGLAIATRKSIDLPIAMLVRARTGAFTASDAEFEVMRQDISYARNIGIDLVVLGLVHEDQTVDIDRTRQLVEYARPMQVTFHRAFDATPDLEAALDDVVQTGATRILTSGAKSSGVLGAPVVHHLREQAGDRINLMLCGGISCTTIQQVLQSSGVSEAHAALRASVRVEPETGAISQESLEYFSECVRKMKQLMHSSENSAN
ncbi:copper homeostasis protein CutC [Granulicella sp. dw_53]|uniref:copper homeostasis protein CutC n=1 Tax=Granulicella sp. dw_53 TaxID=2719792 RepID=UPI001BD4DF50|nr:copper homeostasis protein CutC [Granulicella sp. dw_53]